MEATRRGFGLGDVVWIIWCLYGNGETYIIDFGDVHLDGVLKGEVREVLD